LEVPDLGIVRVSELFEVPNLRIARVPELCKVHDLGIVRIPELQYVRFLTKGLKGSRSWDCEDSWTILVPDLGIVRVPELCDVFERWRVRVRVCYACLSDLHMTVW
jgi:hypothetical protein